MFDTLIDIAGLQDYDRKYYRWFWLKQDFLEDPTVHGSSKK